MEKSRYYIEIWFVLANRKRYLFWKTFFSKIKFTFETQKGLFLVKKGPVLEVSFCEDIKKKTSLLKLKKVPFWWRKYYIENLFILAKRKRYLFGNTFLSQITITFETQKGLFLVKKKVPFQRYVFGTPLKSSFLDHKKVPFLVKKRSLFENGGTILMDFCFKKVRF